MAFSPFDYVKSINEKNYIYEEVDKNNYNHFIVNKALSFFPDAILLVNEINMYSGVTPRQHYDFLYYSVPKRKRYSKWVKPTKYELVDLICEHFQVRYERAIEILSVLDDADLKQLQEEYEKGGKIND